MKSNRKKKTARSAGCTLREKNEQLQRQNLVKNDFVRIVSHEFRTPLTGIRGFSEMIRDEDLTLEQASEMIANAKTAALAMFPDKELAYDLIYRPRFQRLLNERFRLQ